MKKDKLSNSIVKVLLSLFCVTSLFYTSCSSDNEPGKYDLTSGKPTVYYVRLSDPAKSDSLLAGAYMAETICLVGDNLTSIKELYFNDQKAILNINLITKNTLFVTVPNAIPGNVVDKIFMITGSKDTVPYDFKVIVPAPILNKMVCEYVPDGGAAVIEGDYFIDDPNTPLEVIMPGNIPAKVLNVQKTKITFEVPANSTKGFINVKSLYGTTRSKFIFRDDRGMITDYDADYPIVNSWGRAGHIEDDPAYSISGSYLRLSGSFTDPDEWTAGSESDALSHFWAEDNGRVAYNGADAKTAIFKFEANVTKNWSAVPLYFIFAAQGTTNGPLYADGEPHGIWAPWTSTGSYESDGWITIAIPVSEFKYDGKGVSVDRLPASFDNLNIFLASRGFTAGTSCDPEILLDNIRVIPGE
ncbi:MAG: glycan-binding surface protein [Dysgonamonadaceae bacterium]|nr:glycan-binding surface protein [Dysgonamonadaceae bacterium]